MTEQAEQAEQTESTESTGSASKPSAEVAAIIRKHTYMSVASGVLPIPLVDIGILGAIQFRMVRQLAARYEVEFPEHRVKTIIGSLVGLSVASTAGNLLKSIVPSLRILFGVGTLVVPAATTYALGQVFSRHFESGGTVWTFDTERAKEDFKEEVKAGKKVVEENFTGVKP